jgi:hypothetical protein
MKRHLNLHSRDSSIIIGEEKQGRRIAAIMRLYHTMNKVSMQ